MDALYVFQHSKAGDEEIRFSLRSLARNAPFLRKVWVFGDRPAFLPHDTSRIERSSDGRQIVGAVRHDGFELIGERRHFGRVRWIGAGLMKYVGHGEPRFCYQNVVS